jgi:hypothetical protein
MLLFDSRHCRLLLQDDRTPTLHTEQRDTETEIQRQRDRERNRHITFQQLVALLLEGGLLLLQGDKAQNKERERETEREREREKQPHNFSIAGRAVA